jgi:hypothetical protein
MTWWKPVLATQSSGRSPGAGIIPATETKRAADRTRRAAGHAAGPGPRPRQRASRQTAGPPRYRAGHLACPACGREPATSGEALQQREDLAIVWLHLDGDHLTEARHCVECQPHGPVIDVSCSCCGNGPLITGQPPGLGDQLAQPALDWLHAPRPATSPPTAMPRRSQIAASCDATAGMRSATPIVSTAMAVPSLPPGTES